MAIVEMVIVGEFPFNVMEGQGFRKVCWSLEPRFKMSCHGCKKLHEVVCLGKMKDQFFFFKDGGMRILLTPDT